MNERLVANRYRLLRRLAAGGMGEVHLAAQVGPAGYERVVALKRMLPNLVSDKDGLKLFLDEARLMTQLSHRNICQIVELGEDPEGYFVALEFITGASVFSLLEKLKKAGQRLDPYYAIDIAGQIAEALAYAYSARGRDGQPLRLIHRDVTPHNVLLSNAGDVKLIDFGVAKSSQQQHSTQGGMVKGKMGYLSPEQSRGKELDGRSDLFSLGIMLYEMVSGSNPFAKADLVAMIVSIQNDLPPPLGMLDPRWRPLEPVVAKLLAKSPDDRYPDANVAAEALLDLRSTLPRPPQRLGPYVSERFGPELEELAKTISDSQMQIPVNGVLPPSVVAPIPGVPAKAPSSPGAALPSAAEQVSPTLHRSSPAMAPPAPAPQQATVVYARTEMGATPEASPRRMALGATGEEPTAVAGHQADAHADIDGKEKTDEEDPPAGPAAHDSLIDVAIPRRSPIPWIGGAAVLGLVAVVGWHFSESEPTPAPPVVVATPTPAAPPPKTPPPPLAAPPPAPPVVATASSSPPPVPAPVAPPPRPAPEVAPSVQPHTPVSPVMPLATDRTPPKVAAIAETTAKHGSRGKHGKEAPVPSATAASVGALVVSGASHPLTQPSGHLDLADPTGRFQLGLDYAVANGVMKAHLSSTPWALVYVNGPSRGNTKAQAVELPPLSQSPTRIELEHPGIDTAKMVMTFQAR